MHTVAKAFAWALNVYNPREILQSYLKFAFNNNNNNTCFYIAPFQLWGLLKALYRVSLPQRPLHSRDMHGSPYLPTLAKRSETKFPSELHRTSHSHGGLHIARYRLLLGWQVTLRGKTGTYADWWTKCVKKLEAFFQYWKLNRYIVNFQLYFNKKFGR